MVYHPKRFFSGSLAATGNQNLYTVPGDKMAVITEWDLNPTADIANFSHYIQGYVAEHGGNLGHLVQLMHANCYQYHGFYVVGANETIVVAAGSNPGNCWQSIHGLEGNGRFEGGDLFKANLKVKDVGDQTLYTVPEGRTAVIKTIVASNIGAANSVAYRHGATPVALGYFQSIPATGSHSAVLQRDGSWVATSGQIIRVNIGTADTSGVVFYIAGVLY